MKRSNEPIFWSLFGAGGMLAALIGPALVFITGIAVPFGLLLPAEMMNYPRMLAFAGHWAGKAFIFAVIVLLLWHAAHRVSIALHDFGVHARTVTKSACYGFALVASITAGYALYAIGF
jgi:fumarate reductase subunit D